MNRSLNISLMDELRNLVNMRACDDDIYAIPSEYIRDLVRRDMENRRLGKAAFMIRKGVAEILNCIEQGNILLSGNKRAL